MHRAYRIGFVVALAMVGGAVWGQDAPADLAQRDRQLQAEVDAMNAEAPFDAGWNTRVDRAEVAPGLRIVVYGTLTALNSAQLTLEMQAAIAKNARPALIETLCSAGLGDPQSTAAEGVVYQYKTVDGQDAIRVEIDKAECAGRPQTAASEEPPQYQIPLDPIAQADLSGWAAEINAGLPKATTTGGGRLDRVEAVPGMEMNAHFTMLSGPTNGQYTPEDKTMVLGIFRSMAPDLLCSFYQDFQKSRGRTIQRMMIVLHTADGEEIGRTGVAAADCRERKSG